MGIGLTIGGLLFSSASSFNEAAEAMATLSCLLANKLSILNGEIFFLISASPGMKIEYCSLLLNISRIFGHKTHS